jgi:hypothetical protein
VVRTNLPLIFQWSSVISHFPFSSRAVTYQMENDPLIFHWSFCISHSPFLSRAVTIK